MQIRSLFASIITDKQTNITENITSVGEGNCSHINPLTAGVAYIWIYIFYWHIKYHLLNMLKIKYDINQQYLKTVALHFFKSE